MTQTILSAEVINTDNEFKKLQCCITTSILPRIVYMKDNACDSNFVNTFKFL